MLHISRSFVLIAALLAAGGLVAQTVYKSIDDKGNVIYSESPPAKGRDGKIRSTTELTIDPNQNVMPAQKPLNIPPLGRQQPGSSQSADGERSHAELMAEAQAALEAAEAQLKAGSEVQAGDFIGRAGGGVGPSQQRLQRLEELQHTVDEARENLEKIQGGRP